MPCLCRERKTIFVPSSSKNCLGLSAQSNGWFLLPRSTGPDPPLFLELLSIILLGKANKQTSCNLRGRGENSKLTFSSGFKTQVLVRCVCVCWFTVFVFLTSVFLCLMFYHLLFTVCSSCYVFPSLCPAFYVSFHEKLAEFTRHGRGSINKKLPLPSPNYHCCWVYFFSVNIAVRVGRPFFPTIGIGPCGDTSFFIFYFLNLVHALSCQLFFSPSKKKKKCSERLSSHGAQTETLRLSCSQQDALSRRNPTDFPAHAFPSPVLLLCVEFKSAGTNADVGPFMSRHM